jgi:hypothetical protein
VIRKDYILRMIEQFGAIWARLLTQVRAGLFGDARATLDNAYQQLLGLNFDTVRARSSGELLARLQFGVSPADGHERCCVLAALLVAEGELAANGHDPDLAATYEGKALDIVLALRLHQPDLPLPDYAPTVERLVELLHEYQLPSDTSRQLLQFFTDTGAFAKAEDVLFDLLAHDLEPKQVVTLGEAFYDRLEQQDDAVLDAGNFSRDEIGAGRAELRRLGGRSV